MSIYDQAGGSRVRDRSRPGRCHGRTGRLLGARRWARRCTPRRAAPRAVGGPGPAVPVLTWP